MLSFNMSLDCASNRITCEGDNSFRRAQAADYTSVISFLYENIGDCLYMYINAKQYGMENDCVPIWLDTDNEGMINAVLMKYYNSFRIQCVDDYVHLHRIAEVINRHHHTLVFCNEDLSKRLRPFLIATYQPEMTVYMQLPVRYRRFDFSRIVPATERDVPEIARLLCDDPIYAGQCDVEALQAQILERMRSGMGRNFIIRDGAGKIAVHDCIMAQTDDIMIASQFICRADMRKQFLAETMENYIIKYAVDAGKKLFAPMVEERRVKQFLACGASIAGNSCKMIKNNNDFEDKKCKH